MTQERRATEDPRPDFGWVDNAKAILIFLVIVGHLSVVPGRAVIYAFHVPAFLFVTGMRKALAGETLELRGDGSPRYDYVYVDDVIEAMVRVMASSSAWASGRIWR